MEGSAVTRGDIYLVAPEGYEHPFPKLKNERGFLFLVSTRDIRFEEWENRQPTRYRLCEEAVLDSDTHGRAMFRLIMKDIPPFGSHSGDMLAGVIIPRERSKRTVAEALRQRYGPATALLMSDKEWESWLATRRTEQARVSFGILNT